MNFSNSLLKLWNSLTTGRSQWPRGLSRRSSAARLLRSWVRISPGAWMFVCCECCVLSGRGLCDGLITRSEESYRLWCFVVCDQETSKTRRLKPATGLWKIQPQWVVTPGKQTNTDHSQTGSNQIHYTQTNGQPTRRHTLQEPSTPSCQRVGGKAFVSLLL
jgi:hypothetical protein